MVNCTLHRDGYCFVRKATLEVQIQGGRIVLEMSCGHTIETQVGEIVIKGRSKEPTCRFKVGDQVKWAGDVYTVEGLRHAGTATFIKITRFEGKVLVRTEILDDCVAPVSPTKSSKKTTKAPNPGKYFGKAEAKVPKKVDSFDTASLIKEEVKKLNKKGNK